MKLQTINQVEVVVNYCPMVEDDDDGDDDDDDYPWFVKPLIMSM